MSTRSLICTRNQRSILREAVDLLERHADAEGVGHVPEALGPADRRARPRSSPVDGLQVEAVDADLEPAQRLLQRLLEVAPDGHHLAHALHLRGEAVVGLLEFLEREARHLGHHVVDRGLEGGRRGPAGDVVPQLVQRVAHGELGGDLGDREPRGLRGERRGARHARVHLDDDHAPVVRVDRELHVGAARLHADLAQARDRGVAHDLVFLVGERLRRRHRDRVSRCARPWDRGSRSSR